MSARDRSRDMQPALSLAPQTITNVNTADVDMSTHAHVLFSIELARNVRTLDLEVGNELADDLAVGDVIAGDASEAVAYSPIAQTAGASTIYLVPIVGDFDDGEQITRVYPGEAAGLGSTADPANYATVTTTASVTVALYHSTDGESFVAATSLLPALVLDATTSHASILIAASRVNRYVRLRLLGNGYTIGSVTSVKLNAANDIQNSLTASLL